MLMAVLHCFAFYYAGARDTLFSLHYFTITISSPRYGIMNSEVVYNRPEFVGFVQRSHHITTMV